MDFYNKQYCTMVKIWATKYEYMNKMVTDYKCNKWPKRSTRNLSNLFIAPSYTKAHTFRRENRDHIRPRDANTT